MQPLCRLRLKHALAFEVVEQRSVSGYEIGSCLSKVAPLLDDRWSSLLEHSPKPSNRHVRLADVAKEQCRPAIEQRPLLRSDDLEPVIPSFLNLAERPCPQRKRIQ